MPIRKKLLLYFIGLAVFSLVIITADSFYNVDTNIVSDAESKLEAISTIQNNRIASSINNFKIQASQVPSRTSLTDDVVNFNATKDSKYVTSLKARALDVKGSVPDYEAVFILDKDGRTIVHTGPDGIETYLDIKIFNTLKTEKKVFISAEHNLSRDLVLTSPITRNGEFVGLVVIDTQASDIKNINTDFTGLGKTGETLIVFRNENGDAEYLHPPRFAEGAQRLVISKDRIEVVGIQALLKNEGLLKNKVDYRGNEVYAVTKYINELDWGLVVKINTSEISAPIYSHALQLGLLSVFVLIITIIISVSLSRLISKPIEELKVAAGEIERGNFSHHVNAISEDELGQLGEAFNKMVSAVVASKSEIDKKVLEQTKDIQQKQSDMEDQQKAILNILEDVEDEKGNVSREKDKTDAILHSIGDAVFVVDQNLKIVVFNLIAAELSGYTVSEATGKVFSDVLKFTIEDSGKVHDEFIKKAIDTGVAQEMANNTQITRKDGKKIAVSDSAAPLKDKNGEVLGCVVVFRDVTKEREIDKAKTEFVSLASHQLRTPLSSVRWFAEMLLAGDAGKLSKKQMEFVDKIYQGNQRMVELVNALLNVSRIELGTFSVEPEPTDIVAISKSVVEELAPQIKTKKLEISEKYGKIPKFSADPKLLRIVVQNLLSNAVKYTADKGKISVDVSLKDKNVFIQVKDSGYGIPKEQQNKIFTKLFRADNVRVKDTEGTGLGLYIVKSIVDNSGGEISFDSAEDKGTVFYVSLPFSGMKAKEGTRRIE